MNGRNARIAPGQGSQQPIAEDHLPVIGSFRVHTVGRDIRPVHKLPAGFLKPANSQIFELLFVHHGWANLRKRFIQP